MIVWTISVGSKWSHPDQQLEITRRYLNLVLQNRRMRETMKFSIGLILASAFLISCTLEDIPSRNPFDGWTYDCFEPELTVSGAVRGERKCVMHYQIPSNARQVGASAIMSSRSYFLVADQRGRRVSTPSRMQTCQRGPRQHGVDGVSFIGLSFDGQIELLSTGRIYGFQSQREWPYCSIMEYQMPLVGFAEAYAEFSAAATARGL
jgi:hypothetical protein